MRGDVHVRFGDGPRKRAGRKASPAPRSDPYTYVRTWEGFLYVARVIDCYSRRVVGWPLEDWTGSGACTSGSTAHHDVIWARS